MLTAATLDTLQDQPRENVLAEELEFYELYGWCLTPHLIVEDAIRHLREENEKLRFVPEDWQILGSCNKRISFVLRAP